MKVYIVFISDYNGSYIEGVYKEEVQADFAKQEKIRLNGKDASFSSCEVEVWEVK